MKINNKDITMREILEGLSPNREDSISFGGHSITSVFRNFVENPEEPMVARLKGERELHPALDHLRSLLSRVPSLRRWGKDATTIIVQYLGWMHSYGAPGDLRPEIVKKTVHLRNQEVPTGHQHLAMSSTMSDQARAHEALRHLFPRAVIMGGAALWALIRYTGGFPYLQEYEKTFNDLDLFVNNEADFIQAQMLNRQVKFFDVAYYSDSAWELADLIWCEVVIAGPFNAPQIFATPEAYNAIRGSKNSPPKHIINFRNVIRPDRTALRIGKYMDKYRWLRFPVADALALLSIWEVHERIESATLVAMKNWSQMQVDRAY